MSIRPIVASANERTCAVVEPYGLRTVARWVGPAVFVCFCASFVGLTGFAFRPGLSDEGIYYYGALRFSQGALPYRDFFFAHPPVHLAMTALVFKILGGFSLIAGKLIPVAMGLVQALAVYLVARTLLRSTARWVRETAALGAVALLMMSEAFLWTSAHDTGMSQACGFAALSMLLLVRGRPLASGVAAGLGALCLLQVAPMLAGLVVAAAALGRNTMWRWLAGLALISSFAHAWGLAVGGHAFIDQVYLFHLAKRPEAQEGLSRLVQLWTQNRLFATASIASACYLMISGQTRLPLLLTASALAQIVFVTTRPRVYPWYFSPALLAGAILIAVALASVLRACHAFAARGVHARDIGWPGFRRVAAGGCALLVLVLPLFLDGASASASTRHEKFEWVDSPSLGPLNPVVRTMLWRPDADGSTPPRHGVLRFIWRSTASFEAHPALVATVRSRARMKPGTVIFGDSNSVPMVALHSGLRIAGDVVDTNLQRFHSGRLTVAEVQRLLEVHAPALVVLSTKRGLGTLPEVQRMLRSLGVLVERFPDGGGELLLFEVAGSSSP
jgi:hypothetical protein